MIAVIGANPLQRVKKVLNDTTTPKSLTIRLPPTCNAALIPKKTLLLIDDEAAIRRVLSRLLAPCGYTITEAENGADALKKIAERKFSLIVLDHNMPVMDGLTFLTALRNDLRLATPVLMMTGNPDEDLRKKAYALGVFDFINKPEDADVLLARVENGMKIAELLHFHDAMKTEMEVSAAILGKIVAPVEINREKFRLQTMSKSYAGVGGDICLAFGTETERPLFIVGDIMGHGVSAALFTVFVCFAARRAWRETLTPHKILARLNRELKEYLPSNYFVSMFCCYDFKAGVLHYANAGHPPPFICSQGQSRPLEISVSQLLGVREQGEFAAHTTQFGPGDWLMTYTDGIMDVVRDGEHVLDAAISEIIHQALPGAQTFGKLADHLKTQEGFIDDRTIMVLSGV